MKHLLSTDVMGTVDTKPHKKAHAILWFCFKNSLTGLYSHHTYKVSSVIIFYYTLYESESLNKTIDNKHLLNYGSNTVLRKYQMDFLPSRSL